MSDIDVFYVHTAVVEPFLNTSGYGVDLFGPAVTVACFADDTRHQIRSSTGELVISETTLYTTVANAPTFVINSRVTVNGNMSRVMKVNTNDSGPLGLPDHCAVNLT